MKSIRFFFFLLITVAAVSCTNSENPIIQKWALEDVDANELVKGMPVEMQDTLKMMVQAETAREKGKLTYDIRKNGKITINSPDLAGKWSEMNGSWFLTDDHKLFTIELKGKRSEYIVHELTENKLVVELVDKNAEAESISNMVDTKKTGTKVKTVFVSQ